MLTVPEVDAFRAWWRSNLGRAAEGPSVLYPDDQLQCEPLDPSNSTQPDRAPRFSSSALLSHTASALAHGKIPWGETRGTENGTRMEPHADPSATRKEK